MTQPTSPTPKKSYVPHLMGVGVSFSLLLSFLLITQSQGIDILAHWITLTCFCSISLIVGIATTILIQKNRSLEISNHYLHRYSNRLVNEFERLNTQVSQSVAPLYHRDLEGNFTKVNAAMAKLLKFEDEDQLLKSLQALGGNFYTSPSRLSDFLFDAEKGKCRNFQSQVRTYNGGTLWISETVQHVDDPAGAFYEGVMQQTAAPQSKNDITSSLKHAEAMGMVAENIAEQMHVPAKNAKDNVHFLSEVFKSFAAIIESSMKFILPLQKDPKYATQALAFQKALDEAKVDFVLAEIPKALEKSNREIESICDLAKTIKDYSVNEDQEKNLVDLNECIQQAVQLTRNRWQSLTDLKTNFDPQMPLVPCLSSELTEVFLSLIMNSTEAIKDSRADGLGSITIRTTYDPYNAIVKIVDNGGGIPAEVLKKIFIPFFTTKGQGKGQGQGMAYCQNVIVQKHKGDLDIKTELGKGTTITITLPLKKEGEKGKVDDQRIAG